MGTAVAVGTLERECPHCIWMTSKGLFHNKVCHCSHHHADHNMGGGCSICKCDRYDQRDPKVIIKEVKEVIETVTEAVTKLEEITAKSEVTSQLSAAQERIRLLRDRLTEIRKQEKE